MTQTMKALSKLKREEGLWMVDAPIPEIGPNDVLIKIKKTAICGTDVHIYKWDDWAQSTIPAPMIVGHEYVGEIAALGAEVKHLSEGQRVSGEGHIVCGYCRNCRAGKRHLCQRDRGVGVHRQGAFAEYLSLPATNVFPIPNDIKDDIAAIFDPFGNATHTALSFNLVGEDVLITGAGPIGIMAVAICKHVGARHVVITDVNQYRLNLAMKMGASWAINVLETPLEHVMEELGMTEGFDVGLEMSGMDTALNSMLKNMRHGGSVALLGIPSGGRMQVDWNAVIFKGLILKGIYGREMFETWYKMQTMVQGGLDISPVITHQMKAEKFQDAFDIIMNGNSGKILLDWT